jgi:hypothetical protein
MAIVITIFIAEFAECERCAENTDRSMPQRTSGSRSIATLA